MKYTLCDNFSQTTKLVSYLWWIFSPMKKLTTQHFFYESPKTQLCQKIDWSKIKHFIDMKGENEVSKLCGFSLEISLLLSSIFAFEVLQYHISRVLLQNPTLYKCDFQTALFWCSSPRKHYIDRLWRSVSTINQRKMLFTKFMSHDCSCHSSRKFYRDEALAIRKH